MKTYRIAKGWRIFSYIIVPMLLLPFGFLLISPFLDIPDFNINKTAYTYFILPMSASMTIVVTIAFINTIIGKLVIDKNKIYTSGLLINKQLFFNEISGYRATEHFTFIESKTTKTRIKISHYYENGSEILTWLCSNYQNLDEVEKTIEAKEILRNLSFGWSAAERTLRLQKAKKLAKILNWVGGFVAIGTVLLLNHNKYIILLCIIYPFFCLIIMLFSKGLIRIDEPQKTVYPTLFWAFFATSAVVLMRGIAFYKIFDYTNVWLPSISIALGLLISLFVLNQGYIFNKSEKTLSVITLSLLLFYGYAFGTVININCVLDESKPKIFKTIVLKKQISHGKSRSYSLKLAQWNSQQESQTMNVNQDFFDKIKEKDTVIITLKNGKLNIPWFEIEK